MLRLNSKSNVELLLGYAVSRYYLKIHLGIYLSFGSFDAIMHQVAPEDQDT
jgi:hypothetical protein